MNYCHKVLTVCLLLLSLAVNAVLAKNAVTAAADTAVDGSTSAAAPAPRRTLDINALLAGDDSEDDLLTEEEPAVKSAAADSAPPGAGESAEMPNQAAEPVADETASAVPADLTSRPYAAGADGAADAGESGPVTITDGRTINFAQNLKEYRSPRVAMLLSLLVPGLGQAYSRSYTKAAAFGAVEVVTLGIAAYFNSAGKSKKNKAHRLADENFSVENLAEYERRLREAAGQDTVRLPDYDEFFEAARAGGRSSYYYESIRDVYYTPGWTDNDLPLDTIRIITDDGWTNPADSSRYVLYSPDPGLFYLVTRVVDASGRSVNVGPLLGNSSNQARYNSMIKDANSYHETVSYALYVLLVNHISSAIDAGFTARAHNARLLGQESVWERVSVEQQYVFTGSEVSPGLALKVRF